MKVAFITRSTLYSAPGGDTIQAQSTAKYLMQQGIEVDIKLASDQIDYPRYQILHFFNIIRPADMLLHIRRSGKPYVVSTNFVDYSDTPGKLSNLPANTTEYLKAIARWMRGTDKLVSPEFLWKGQRNSIRHIIRNAACLLPNSQSEYERLEKAFGLQKKYYVVPNGIDPEIFKEESPQDRDPYRVLCVGRIEAIKNQLNLIKALNNSRFKLYLIGNAAPNQQAYYRECGKVASDNIFFIENLPQSQLCQHYRKASVHVLPSWFETTGLSSLEAAALGCKIVISNRGDAKEYFGDKAFYCDPASPASILDAIEKAAASSADPTLRKKVYTKFTWTEAALRTIGAYRLIQSYENSNHRHPGNPQQVRGI